MILDIVPEDVYAEVMRSRKWTVIVLLICGVVSPLVLWSLWMLRTTVKDMVEQVKKVLQRVGTYVDVAAGHGKISDDQKERAQVAVATASVKAVQAVRKAEDTARTVEQSQSRLEDKIDGLVKVADGIHSLVNSTYLVQLRISAVFARRIADMTGQQRDRDVADDADRMVQEQVERECKAAKDAAHRRSA